ncbi:DUF3429 family protein [Oecophyllibacter saccharovorans]|nr:DUF3429 family protein [Oecophyllibacter saccharovorans]
MPKIRRSSSAIHIHQSQKRCLRSIDVKPFPALVVALNLVAAFAVLTSGSILFMAGTFRPLPEIAVALLAFGGCLGAFEGAVHWGFTIDRPDVILPRTNPLTDRRRAWLGGGALLWFWLALCVGLLCSFKAGFLLEALGFALQFAIERIAGRWGRLPPGYQHVKLAFTVLVEIGLVLAALSPLGKV